MTSVGKSDLQHIDNGVTSVIDKMLRRFFISEKKLTDPSDDDNLIKQAKCLGYLALVKTTIMKTVNFEDRLENLENTLSNNPQFNMGLFDVPNNTDLR